MLTHARIHARIHGASSGSRVKRVCMLTPIHGAIQLIVANSQLDDPEAARRDVAREARRRVRVEGPPVGGDSENPGFCRRRAELRGCAYPEEPA